MTTIHTSNVAAQIVAAAARITEKSNEISDLATQIGGAEHVYYPTIPSQRDPLWRDDVFAGGMKFRTDGCYVCSYAWMTMLAGYTDDPPAVAAKLRDAGCFNGAYFSHPERAQQAYPKLRFDGAHQWHNTSADMDLVYSELEKGPLIAEVDFVWSTQKFNQHFVVILDRYGEDDLWIADPWDGSLARLLLKYAGAWWALKRGIYGLRIFRVVE